MPPGFQLQAQPTRQPSVPAPSGADVSRESHAAPEPVGAVLEVDGWLAVARRSEGADGTVQWMQRLGGYDGLESMAVLHHAPVCMSG